MGIIERTATGLRHYREYGDIQIKAERANKAGQGVDKKFRNTGIRKKIWEKIKEDGPMDTVQLAEAFGVTNFIMKNHLYDLKKTNRVYAVGQRPGSQRANIWKARAVYALGPAGNIRSGAPNAAGD